MNANTLATDFSVQEGTLSDRLIRAADNHVAQAIADAEIALSPAGSVGRSPTHARNFHQHLQAATTLREVACLLG
jgi:hypothetical protein